MSGVIGTEIALFRMYGWKTYLFAESGFAWLITLALIRGWGVLVAFGAQIPALSCCQDMFVIGKIIISAFEERLWNEKT